MKLAFVLPGDLTTPTGGNRYDVALAEALEDLGVEVERRPVPGDWPVGTPAHRRALAAALRGLPGDGVTASDEAVNGAAGGGVAGGGVAGGGVAARRGAGWGGVLVDGLLACGAPEVVEAARGVAVLVHLPLALETGADAGLDGLERRALAAASRVIATSEWAAADLRRRHGLDEVAVAVPGTEPAPAAEGSDPPQLLHLASVTPRKDQLGVVEALALVADEPWTAVLAGSLGDEAYVARVRASIDRHGLAGRVALTGPLHGGDLEKVWAATDLLLLPSRAETWGMAVTEALARGVPAIVGAGTGAAEALGRAEDGSLPGALVPPGDPDALAAALRTLLGPARTPARAAARSRAATLPTWHDTARTVLAALT